MKIIHALSAVSAALTLALSGCCCPDASGRTFGYSDSSARGTAVTYSNVSSPSYASESRVSSLEGKEYDVTIQPGNGRNAIPTRLTFEDGRVASSACQSVGFNEAPYVARPTTSGTRFTAACDSAKIGHNEWEGTVDGDRIEGTVITTPRNGGTPVRSRFSGTCIRE